MLRRWYHNLLKRSAHRPLWPLSRRVVLPKLTEIERRSLLNSLKDHPGWHYIMANLENRKAAHEMMRGALIADPPKDFSSEQIVRELTRINATITCLGSIQDAINRAGAMPPLTTFAGQPAPQQPQAVGI